MHVLYIHQHFSTPAGSTGIRSYEMARRLIARGHRVTMLCGSYKGACTGLDAAFTHGMRRGMVEGIDVIELDCAYANAQGLLQRSMVFFKFALRSIWVALREPYDVVFATTTPLTAGIPGIAARWLRGKRFVFEVRDLWPELPKAMGVVTNPVILAGMSALEWASYRSAHRLIGLSPGIVAGITRHGVDAACVTLISNGCDMELFASDARPWRPEGIAPDALMAVYAGTHGMANGLDALLDAAAELKKRGCEDIRILLIGDGKLKPNLAARAADEGLRHVVFHSPVNKERLAGLMKSTDIGLQTLANVPAFYYGTSPNKFFDYIASGVPVLTNYPGWVAELVQQHGCGIAVPPVDASAFADALMQMADDRATLAAMGTRASALARAEFDRTKLADRFVDWLEMAAR
jgi:glycosyltransferase involved in cell wall biosynthesis